MNSLVHKNEMCEVCGNDDLPCLVACSCLGAMSFNTCGICSAMSAEPRGLANGLLEEGVLNGDFCTIYDKTTDKYLWIESKDHCYIRFKDGSIASTRKEAWNFLNKLPNHR